MPTKTTAIHHFVEEALRHDRALSLEEILALRKKSRQTIKSLKVTFWMAIILLNIALWVPLPFEVGRPFLIAIVALCLLVAFVPPIFGIRTHQSRLEQLAEHPTGPQKRKTGEDGKAYVEKVRAEGRLFIRAEVEVLEGRELKAEEGKSAIPQDRTKVKKAI